MKLAILGGGGFRVPLVYGALLRDTASPRVDEVALYDQSPERLAVIESVLSQLAKGYDDPPKVVVTTDLDKALEGAHFVFAAIRVGGLEGRTRDERVALNLGVLGQETTGPGGLAYGLRTIPEMLRIAERVKALAPEAYFINFTNPAGMITEALQRVLGERVIGICDTPGGLGRRIAGSLGIDATRVQVDYVGLNHLGWLRRLIVEGRDRLPEFLANAHAVSALEEGAIFGPAWLQTLGVVPNEYLYYYYFNRDAVRSIIDQPNTRGEFLARQQADFYRAAGEDSGHALDLWRQTIAERKALYMAEAKGKRHDDTPEADALEIETEEAGYERVALAVMAAIARDEKSTIILNVRNGGTLSGLDADAVIEVPSLVDANGAHPLATTAPDLHQLGLMQQIKAVERLTIEAATTGSSDAALKAFALHPLVDSVSVARDLLRGYVDAEPEIARVLGQD
ncbi:6-phospho-beta-glucosidase [Actinopolymorpha alba]|uniref:6-phospho-beta-glucosidase n=1 Tax=Actinopolymorpha alba TaxID=533267 RepID=UPI00036DFF44|nr:6-phospho-beta-glucosidase [Actinopolymorpha alba]